MASRGNKNKKDKPDACTFCCGSGKIDAKSDDTDIWGLNAGKRSCPVCHGRGRILRFLRGMRIRFGRLPKRIPPKKRGRSGGRLSRSQFLLPPPGAAVSGWSEGDLVPKSNPESACPHLEYYRMDNDISEEEDNLNQSDGESTLRCSDDKPITSGKQFPPNLVLDSELAKIDPLEAPGSNSQSPGPQIIYDFESDEGIDPSGPLAAIQPGDETYAVGDEQVFDIKPCREDMETSVRKYDLNPDINMEDPALPDLTLSQDLPPAGGFASPPENTLDITGIDDPFGFDIDTDVTGNTGF